MNTGHHCLLKSSNAGSSLLWMPPQETEWPKKRFLRLEPSDCRGHTLIPKQYTFYFNLTAGQKLNFADNFHCAWSGTTISQISFVELKFDLITRAEDVSCFTCSTTHMQRCSVKQVRREKRRSCCYKLSSHFRTSYPSPLINCKRWAWTSSIASQITVLASGRSGR